MTPSTVTTIAIIVIAALFLLIALGSIKKEQRIRRLEKELERRKREAARKKPAPRRKKSRGWFALLLVLTACGARVVYVDPSNAFVYPSGGQAVLVLESGEYRLDGTTLPAGCYRLEGSRAVYAGKDGCQ